MDNLTVLLAVCLLGAGWRLPLAGGRVPRGPLFVPMFFLAMLAYELNQSVAHYVFIATAISGIPLLSNPFPRQKELRLTSLFASPVPWAAALCIWLTMRDGVSNGFELKNISELPVQIAIIWLFARGFRSNRVSPDCLLRWASYFIGTALLIGAIQGNQWLSCTNEFGKCSAVGRIYVGIFNSANAVAIFSLVALLLTFLVRRSKPRSVLIASLILTAVITGSRTPEVALGVAIILGAASAFAVPVRKSGRGVASNRLVGAALACVTPAMGLLIVWHFHGSSFSNRGFVWQQIEGFVSPTSLIGRGKTVYENLLSVGLFRGHYPHSEYLLLLFFGGLIAVSLYAIFLFTLWARASAATRWELFLRLLPLLVIMVEGLTELTWNAAGLDSDIWIVVAMIAAVECRSHYQNGVATADLESISVSHT